MTEIHHVEKLVRGGKAFYTVNWSPMRKADKYDIQKVVPARAGLFELYYKDGRGKLRLFHFGKVWLGGLRAVIREMTDPILMKDRPDFQKLLSTRECFYRYCLCDSLPDLEDVLHFFSKEEKEVSEASGRYSEIRLKEASD